MIYVNLLQLLYSTLFFRRTNMFLEHISQFTKIVYVDFVSSGYNIFLQYT